MLLPDALMLMVSGFGKSVRLAKVSDLVSERVLFVEDGNHGEYRPLQHEFVSQGVPFIRPPDLKDGRIDFDNCDHINETAFRRVRKGIAHGGDIILTHRATVGRLALAALDAPVFVTNPGTTVWRSTDPEIIEQRYLYYFMQSAGFLEQLFAQVGHTTTFDYVSLTQQRSLTIAIPPLSEQRAIAHILGSLDDKIELNRQMNATLEEMARAIFKSWFVDFDPVHAKARGEQPVGMDAATAALFPDSFEESELGMVPSGWRVGNLPEAIEVNPSRRLRHGEVAPYLDMSNMPTASARATNIHTREFGSGMKFMNGDTLVARITPCLENGKTCFVDFLELEQTGWGSTEYIVLRSKVSLPLEYSYFLARTERFRTFAISNMTGTSGRQRVPSDSFKQFVIVVPSEEIGEKFGDFASLVLKKMKANDDESRTLADLRDTLLPKLMSGEVRMPEVTVNH